MPKPGSAGGLWPGSHPGRAGGEGDVETCGSVESWDALFFIVHSVRLRPSLGLHIVPRGGKGDREQVRKRSESVGCARKQEAGAAFRFMLRRLSNA